MLFHCKKVTEQGYVTENFFREAANEEELMNGLDMFYWKEGQWTIEEA